MIDHRLYATRGYHPGKRSMFSVATRGFSFGSVVRLGIKMLSPILTLIGLKSLITIKSNDESPIV